jgi:hypothetical protein
MDCDLAGLNNLTNAQYNEPGITNINGIQLPIIQQGNAGCGGSPLLVPCIGLAEGLHRVPLPGLKRHFREPYQFPRIDPRVHAPRIPTANTIRDAQGINFITGKQRILTTTVCFIRVGYEAISEYKAQHYNFSIKTPLRLN